MRFDADELEEQNSLDYINYKRSKKGKKHEFNVQKHKARSKRPKRRDIILEGCRRGQRKRFLSAFSGRPSMAKQGRNTSSLGSKTS